MSRGVVQNVQDDNLRGSYIVDPFQSLSGNTLPPVVTVVNSQEKDGHIYNGIA